MAKQKNQATMQIACAPEGVLGFIADVRNRTRFLPSLKSLTDIQGDPAAAGTTWKWKFNLLGQEFAGTGRSLKFEPGRLYSFQTEGGLESTWTYRAEPAGGGTKLTIDVEFTVPEALASRLPSGTAFESLKKAEADLVTHNLKA